MVHPKLLTLTCLANTIITHIYKLMLIKRINRFCLLYNYDNQRKIISPHTDYCQGGEFADRTCKYSKLDTNTDCMNTTLQCVNNLCSADINSESHFCTFNTYNGVNVTARCCFCNNSTSSPPQQWWYCGNTISSVSPSLQTHSTYGESLTSTFMRG